MKAIEKSVPPNSPRNSIEIKLLPNPVLSQAVGRLLSGVAPLALGIALSFDASPTRAGSCIDLGNGVFQCEGTGDATNDFQQSLEHADELNVTTNTGFGMDVARGAALRLIGRDVTFTDDQNATIVARQNAARGIAALATGGIGDINITSNGSVTAGSHGIEATLESEGSITINAFNVTSYDADGIRALTSSNVEDVTVNVEGTVIGQWSGIYAENNGTGALNVTAANVTGLQQAAIIAHSSGTDINITTTGTVYSENTGIEASLVDGSGTLNITVSGSVYSEDWYAISAENDYDQMSVIDLQDGALVSSGYNRAITNERGDSHVYLRSGSRVEGWVELGTGQDNLTIEGGASFSEGTIFDGGVGEDGSTTSGPDDVLNFSGYTGTLNPDQFNWFETLTASNGGTVTLGTAMASEFSVMRVTDNATLSTESGNFTYEGGLYVGPTGRLQAGGLGTGTTTLSGSILNDGVISLADGHGGDHLDMRTDLVGTGTIGLDLNLSTGNHDYVTVASNTTGASMGLDVDTTGSGNGSAQDYTLVTVQGASSATDFELVDGDFVTNEGEQAITDGDIVYGLAYDAESGTFFLTPLNYDGSVAVSPGGDLYAAAVQQASDQMVFGATLGRVMGAAQNGASGANTVSRALSELTSTKRPLIWIQAEGQRDSYSVDDRDVDTNIAGLRFGVGLPLAELSNGVIIGGLEFGISSLSTDVSTSLTRADIDTDAYDATLSLLWIANSQLYVDGQLRYGYFDSTIRPNGGDAVGSDSTGYGLSVEVGKPFALTNGLTLIPQAQLMYSDLDTDDVFDLAGGAQTGSLVDGDTLTARIGLRAERTLVGSSVVFGQFDYYHAFDNETSVAFGSNTVLTERVQNTVALTLGGHVALTPRSSLYGEIIGETGLGSGSGDYAYGGNIGWELRF
ncbi:autotransporter outer membrane beta-barrel domain-containing protein [Ruegeria sp. SCP11]|uniref:autotransporter outer membrane beta-barrel domain-containing protein n=1 Tax=Ruegeria sp. SCP11 TaxID=3141378 RepID=UPI003339642A